MRAVKLRNVVEPNGVVRSRQKKGSALERAGPGPGVPGPGSSTLDPDPGLGWEDPGPTFLYKK